MNLFPFLHAQRLAPQRPHPKLASVIRATLLRSTAAAAAIAVVATGGSLGGTQASATAQLKAAQAKAATLKPVDCSVKKCVALTFDDGPAASTPALVRTLSAKQAQATFFVLGTQAAKYPEVLKSIAAGGNEIGTHSVDHAKLTTLSSAAVAKEVNDSSATIERITGQRPTALRPPYGETNATVGAAARAAGLAQVMWSVDPRDWANRDSALVTSRVLGSARAGSIVILHDIHPTTVAAVPKIIDGLRAKGFTLVTVSQLLPREQPGLVYRSRTS